MPLLPPEHVTLPFAATYLAAAILHDNHSPDAEVRALAPFEHCRLVVDRHTAPAGPDVRPRPPRLTRYALVSTSLRTHAGPGPSRRDPTRFEVTVTFTERDDRTLYMAQPGCSPAEIKRLELTLAPPVVGCFSRTRLRAGLNARGLVAIGAPLPDSMDVRVAPFEERLVTRYRQVLAEGLLAAVLVDEDGHRAPIPAAHWRRDGASGAFVEPHPVVMMLDGRDVRGHVFVDLSELRTGWRDAFGALPASAELAEAEYPAAAARVGTAPLLDFAVYVARKLGIADGRGPDGLPIVAGNLEALLKNELKAYGFEGEQADNRARSLSMLLRNPDEKSGPKAAWSTLGKA